jgi:DNA replication protein DnaC
LATASWTSTHSCAASHPTRARSQVARVDVLVIDDCAMAPLAAEQRQDLLEILEDRHGHRSTIIASQLDTTRNHDYLCDPTLADAVCDRLLHNAHRLVLQGPSRRKEVGSAK